MKIPWPSNYIALFRAKSMLASVGEELLNIRCAIGAEEGGLSIAALEYYKTLAYAAVPGVLVASSTLCWYICGRSVPRPERRAMMTGTIVLLMYLAYPSISAIVLGLWKWIHWRIRVDICGRPRGIVHWWCTQAMAVYIGIAMFVCVCSRPKACPGASLPIPFQTWWTSNTHPIWPAVWRVHTWKLPLWRLGDLTEAVDYCCWNLQ